MPSHLYPMSTANSSHAICRILVALSLVPACRVLKAVITTTLMSRMQRTFEYAERVETTNFIVQHSRLVQTFMCLADLQGELYYLAWHGMEHSRTLHICACTEGLGYVCTAAPIAVQCSWTSRCEAKRCNQSSTTYLLTPFVRCQQARFTDRPTSLWCYRCATCYAVNVDQETCLKQFIFFAL